MVKRWIGCELLSNHYLCAKKNSCKEINLKKQSVVNCFQIIIFVLRRTAAPFTIDIGFSCELLSNHYLCAKKNSYNSMQTSASYVVNCFQIIIFVLRRTAKNKEVELH